MSFSELVEAHLPCPDCGSSDGLAVYTDHTFCFVCEKYTANEHQVTIEKGEGSTMLQNKHKKLPKIPLADMEYKAIKARGLTMNTCSKYHYSIGKMEWGEPVQVASYLDEEGNVVFQKARDKDKNFLIMGKKSYRFFGQELFPTGKKLVITEGEIDCLTVSQVQGNKYPVVSIPFGTKSAVETFKQQYEWLNGFEEIIIMFDMDEAGRKAVDKVGGILPPHKMKIAALPLKDPNECLLAGKADAIVQAIWNAKEYRPDGIVNAKDYKELFFKKQDDVTSYDFPFGSKLNAATKGLRKGEMLLLTAGTGIGKSTMARELAYDLKVNKGLRIGMVMLEENVSKTLRDLLSIHLQKPLHLQWQHESVQEEAKVAYDELYGDGNFILYDHFGSIEDNNLLDKIRYMIVSSGCDFVVLDHITIAISGLDTVGDERRCIDRLMTKLRSLVEETGAGLIVISHLRKSDTKSTPFEQGGIISLDDLRGSGSLKQIPDTILALERNQQIEDESMRNVIKVRILKCRFTGKTGLADKLKFDEAKYRLTEVDPLEQEENQQDESPF